MKHIVRSWLAKGIFLSDGSARLVKGDPQTYFCQSLQKLSIHDLKSLNTKLDASQLLSLLSEMNVLYEMESAKCFESIGYILICYNVIYSEYHKLFLFWLICIFVNISHNLVMHTLNNCTKSIVYMGNVH